MNIFSATASTVVNATLLVLLMLSITTWSIALIKLYQQGRDNRANKVFLAAFWAAREWQHAAKACEEMTGTHAYLARAGFAGLRDMQQQADAMHYLGSPQEGLERGLRQAAQCLQRQLESGLTILASIGTTAPFVGLFGTVWGIMHALQEISITGASGLGTVAGPIGEALVATALGIATALPAVLFYNFYLRRLRLSVTDLGNFAQDFMRLAAKHDYKA